MLARLNINEAELCACLAGRGPVTRPCHFPVPTSLQGVELSSKQPEGVNYALAGWMVNFGQRHQREEGESVIILEEL